MSHPAAPLPSDLEFNCPDKEVIWTLFKFIQGCPLPRNVIKNIDPYNFHPEYLPGKSHVLLDCNILIVYNLGSLYYLALPPHPFFLFLFSQKSPILVPIRILISVISKILRD